MGPIDDDYRSLELILTNSNWKPHRAYTCKHGLKIMRDYYITIVICDQGLPDGDWTRILKAAASRPDPPLLIVTSRHAEAKLLDQIRNLEAYDLLLKPFDPEEVAMVMSSAWGEWYQRHDLRRAGNTA